MKSSILGKISFWLAVSHWLCLGAQLVRLPGFGRDSILGCLAGFLIIFAPPVSFVIGLVAIFVGKSRWAKAGLTLSSITFALWLIIVVCGILG